MSWLRKRKFWRAPRADGDTFGHVYEEEMEPLLRRSRGDIEQGLNWIGRNVEGTAEADFNAARRFGSTMERGAMGGVGGFGIGYMYDKYLDWDYSNRKRRYEETNFQTLPQQTSKRLRGSSIFSDTTVGLDMTGSRRGAGVVGEDGAARDINPDLDAEAQFNSEMNPQVEKNNTLPLSYVGFKSKGFPRGYRRAHDAVRYRLLRLRATGIAEQAGTAETYKWNAVALPAIVGHMPLNSHVNLAQTYSQAIAVNGSSGQVAPGDGTAQTSNTNALITQALMMDHTLMGFKSATSAAGVILSGNTDHAHRYTRNAQFYLEHYRQTLTFYNGGNADETIRLLVVSPRRAIKRGQADTEYLYPCDLEWITYMNKWASENTGIDNPYYDQTTDANTIPSITDISGDPGVPFGLAGAGTFSGLNASKFDWREFNRSIFGHRTVDRYFKIKQVKFLLHSGQRKTIVITVPRQLVKMEAATTFMLPNLNYKLFVMSRGEIATGREATTSQADLGFSKHTYTMKSDIRYSVRYAHPHMDGPMEYELVSTNIAGGGVVIDEVQGGAEPAADAPMDADEGAGADA
jgi:hypothetical protein